MDIGWNRKVGKKEGEEQVLEKEIVERYNNK